MCCRVTLQTISLLTLALSSDFGFVLDEISVRETAGTLSICVEMLSPGPLLEFVSLRTAVVNGSANGREKNYTDCVYKLYTVFFINAVQEDYALIDSEFFFSRGSRQGDTSCGAIVITNDGRAEFPEELLLNLISPMQRVATVDPAQSQLHLSIVDDDGELPYIWFINCWFRIFKYTFLIIPLSTVCWISVAGSKHCRE